MGWAFAIFFFITLIVTNNANKQDVEALTNKLEKTKKDFEDFKNSDPEQKRLKLNFERQFNNIKTINVNIKELVDALNYAKKKQNRLDLVTDYNNHTITITGKGFNTIIKGN